MAVMDEFKAERETIKNASLKDKAIYFFDYYKGHVIAALVIIFVIGSIIHQWVTHKEIVFHAVMMNSTKITEEVETYPMEFAEKLGLDTDEYDIRFDTSIYITENFYDEAVVANMQKLVVYQMAGDVDTMISDYTTAESYVYNDSFVDISLYMTDEQIEKLEPYFIYADQAIIDAKGAARESGETPEEVIYPDPQRPDEMENPIPIGISLKDSPAVKNQYFLPEQDVNLHIFKCTTHPEYCTAFIDYMCAELLD